MSPLTSATESLRAQIPSMRTEAWNYDQSRGHERVFPMERSPFGFKNRRALRKFILCRGRDATTL